MNGNPSLPQVRAGLLQAAEPTSATALPAHAFHAWLFEDQARSAELAQAAAEAFALAGERSAGHVATLGYAAGLSNQAERIRPLLIDGLTWLGDRAWFRPNQARTLEADGVSAFGVSLGARHAGVAGVDWLRSLVVRSASLPDLSALDRSLMVAAAHLIDAPGRQDGIAMIPEARLGLSHLEISTVDDACREAAWQRILRFASAPAAVPEAALLLKALDVLTERSLPARLGRLEPEDVLHVLEGVQRALRRWTWEAAPRTSKSAVARWEVENEYHVQNLLWAMLAPLFPDLNDEQSLAPVGQKSPRADLTIPSLATVVEVKFMRQGARFQDVIEEIAADASLYGADPHWTSLIPFVWDDARRVEEHQKLISGLRHLPGVIGAVVVARPGKMDRLVASRPTRKTRSPNDPASAQPAPK